MKIFGEEFFGSKSEGTGGSRIVLPLGFILLFAAVVFFPVTGFDFLYWDDPLYVTGNVWIRGLSPGSLRRYFSAPLEGIYQPLTYLSYTLQYAIGGPGPEVFHSFSLFLHLVNAALVFFFLRLLDKRPAVPFLGALVFAIHPQRAEAVAWVSAQKDLLCTSFFIASLTAWLHYAKDPSKKRYSASFLFFVLACLAKSMAVTIPLLLLLLDWREGRKDYKKALLEKIPFFAVAVLTGLMAVAAREEFEEILREFTYDPSYRLFSAAYRLVYYHFGRFFYPWTGGDVLYPRWEDLSAGVPLSYLFLLPALAAILAATYIFIRRNKDLALMALFYLLTIFPTLGIISVGSSADRYNYLPSVALSSLFALLAAGLLSRVGKLSVLKANLLFAAIVLAALGYGYGARAMALDWKDDVSLLSRVIEGFPETAGHAYNRSMALNDRGWIYLGRDEAGAALADFEESIRLNPSNGPAYRGKGVVLGKTGDARGAIEALNKSLELGFETPDTYLDLAGLYHFTGNAPAAWSSAQRAAALGARVPPELLEKIQRALGQRE